MAGYFTHFSCLLDVGSPGNADRAIVIYDEALDSEGNPLSHGFSLDLHDHGPGLLHIHDGGSGNPECVIAFVKLCIKAFDLTGRWGFQFANTCSRPRLDGFGGGAHVLDLATGDTVAWADTDVWLAGQLAGPQ